jgi:hypothetical protein
MMECGRGSSYIYIRGLGYREVWKKVNVDELLLVRLKGGLIRLACPFSLVISFFMLQLLENWGWTEEM